MPHEEKKRFKAVTEEISNTPPVMSAAEVSVPPILTHTQQVHHEDKHQNLGVAETNNFAPNLSEKPKKNLFLFLTVMLLVAFVVMALAGGMYVYLNGVKNLPQTEVAENQPSETAVPQTVVQATPPPAGGPTATPKPDYSLYNVSVLNGSGAIGVATGVKDLIQKGGFKVSYTGNADNFGFSDTVIQVKNTVSADVVAALRNLLVPTYSIKIGAALDAQSRWDIIITVGTK